MSGDYFLVLVVGIEAYAHLSIHGVRLHAKISPEFQKVTLSTGQGMSLPPAFKRRRRNNGRIDGAGGDKNGYHFVPSKCMLMTPKNRLRGLQVFHRSV